MGALAAVHLAAHDPLRVLDGNAALSVVDEDDEHDDGQGAQDHQHQDPPLEGADDDVADALDNADGQTGNDAGKQDHGDAVADAMLGDLLTQPHDESGAGGEGQHNDDGGPDAALCLGRQDAVVLDQHVEAEALQQTDGNGDIAGDGCDLLPAFLALFLAHTLQCGDGDAQQLNDNGSVNVGLDGQGEDGCLGECAARHDVQQAQNGVLEHRKVALQCCNIDIRNRDGVAKTIKQNDEKGEEDLSADLFNSPCIA